MKSNALWSEETEFPILVNQIRWCELEFWFFRLKCVYFVHSVKYFFTYIVYHFEDVTATADMRDDILKRSTYFGSTKYISFHTLKMLTRSKRIEKMFRILN